MTDEKKRSGRYPWKDNPVKLECIEKMEVAFGIEFVKHFCLLNAFEYVECYRDKSSFKQDIEKAIWYLKRLASYINDEELEAWISLGYSNRINDYAYQYAAEIELTRIQLGDGNEIIHIGYAIAYLTKLIKNGVNGEDHDDIM